MKFLRFEDSAGAVTYGISHADGSVTVAEGCPFSGSGLKDTGRAATVARYLSPVDPPMVVCIGLNYRKHANELKLPCPTNPVSVFVPHCLTASLPYYMYLPHQPGQYIRT